MSRAWLYVLVAALALGAGALVSTWLRPDPNTTAAGAGPTALLGHPAPPFTRGNSEGRRVSLDEFSGRVVLINFWATWCAPCRKEMPMLQAVHEEFESQGLSLLGIALDDVQRARDFADQFGIGYPILVGAGDVMATGVAYGNEAGLLPYSVLIDRQGVVRWTYLGELKEGELRRQLQALL